MKRIGVNILVLFACLSFFTNFAFAEGPMKVISNGHEYNLVIYDQNEFAVPVNFLEETLKKINFIGNAKIKECTTIIDIPAGTAKGNHSIGGICKISSDTGISNGMICGDYYRGSAIILAKGENWNSRLPELIEFVIDNCVGG